MAVAPLAGRCAAETPSVAPLDAGGGGDKIEIQFSPYTYHFSGSEGHSNVLALALSSVDSSGWLWGGSYFRNSFGQPCAYVFGGRKYEEPFGLAKTYWSWTAGVLYGYKPPYEDKVPLNHQGFSPGAVLTLGWQFTPQLSTQLNAVGTAGIMIQFSLDFR